MKFFIPHTKTAEAETMYDGISESLRSQFRMPIDQRRIFSLNYVNGRKRRCAEVGQLEPVEGRYEILAIYESKQYIVFTRTLEGESGVTIMVDKDEVTGVEDFD